MPWEDTNYGPIRIEFFEMPDRSLVGTVEECQDVRAVIHCVARRAVQNNVTASAWSNWGNFIVKGGSTEVVALRKAPIRRIVNLLYREYGQHAEAAGEELARLQQANLPPEDYEVALEATRHQLSHEYVWPPQASPDDNPGL